MSKPPLSGSNEMIVASPQPVIPAEEVKKMPFEAAPVIEISQAVEKVHGFRLDLMR